jgi:uncharacterized protein (DUF2141 family)
MHFIIYLFPILLSILSPNKKDNTGNYLKVTISNIQEDKGNIRLGLYKDAATFPITGKQYKGYEFAVKNHKASIEIHHIPPGKYAIAVLHDVNSNQKMDKNILGIPLEPYGFSNNARATFSAPTFESASFQHDGSTNLTIKVY